MKGLQGANGYVHRVVEIVLHFFLHSRAGAAVIVIRHVDCSGYSGVILAKCPPTQSCRNA